MLLLISIGWKAWFQTPGKQVQQFSSKTTSWDDLPLDGLQRIIVYFDETWGSGRPYRRVISGNDFYYLIDNEFIQTDEKLDDPSEKLGRAIPDKDWEEIKTESWDKYYF